MSKSRPGPRISFAREGALLRLGRDRLVDHRSSANISPAPRTCPSTSSGIRHTSSPLRPSLLPPEYGNPSSAHPRMDSCPEDSAAPRPPLSLHPLARKVDPLNPAAQRGPIEKF